MAIIDVVSVSQKPWAAGGMGGRSQWRMSAEKALPVAISQLPARKKVNVPMPKRIIQTCMRRFNWISCGVGSLMSFSAWGPTLASSFEKSMEAFLIPFQVDFLFIVINGGVDLKFGLVEMDQIFDELFGIFSLDDP